MSLKRTLYVLLLAVLSCVLYSCRTLKQPKSIPEPINYTDEDIVKIEIDRIMAFTASEPVRALWRAELLGREEVIENTKNNLVLLFENAIAEKNYFEAKKYYKSLTTVGWTSDKYSGDEIEKLYSQDIPGISTVNDKVPASISDCMDATVTIWVDRGIKVEHGNGYYDVVLGSGFFIDKRGYIVTNHHVIESMVDPKYEGYSRLYIKAIDDPDTKIPAKVIGYDSVLDLALLKTEIEPKFVLNLGESKDLHIGDRISAIGTPVGLEGTLTSGIISSTERKLFTLGNVFQIDAAVNSGNSGGPLIDEKLKVQAIVFAGMPIYQGLNFAIPVEYLRQELNIMYNCGEVVHPWIASYGHTKRNGKKKVGLEIQYVLPGGSAFMSGLRAGDVITEIDGHTIDSIETFHYVMMAYEPETLLKCKYVDGEDKVKETYVYLEMRPENPSVVVMKTDFLANAFVPLFGMKLVASSTTNRNSYTIESIVKGSTADEMNFSEFDSITVKDLKKDDEREVVYSSIYAQRRKKGFIDIGMVLSTSFDNPYYF